MLTFKSTAKFDRDMKRIRKRGLDLSLIQDIIQTLLQEKTLPQKHDDHALSGNYAGFRECHIQPDWLLIYTIDKGDLILTASRSLVS